MPLCMDQIEATDRLMRSDLLDGRTLLVGRWVYMADAKQDVFKLTFRGMFKTAVGNGLEQLGLQEKVAETGRVDSNI